MAGSTPVYAIWGDHACVIDDVFNEEIANIEGDTVWQRDVPLSEMTGPGWR